MRIGKSATVSRQPAAQTSGSDASIQFAQPGSVTRLARRSLYSQILPRTLSLRRPARALQKKSRSQNPALLVLKHLQTLSFTLLHSFAFPKWQSPCFQSTAHSLAKNTRGGGYRLEVKLECFDYSARCNDMTRATTAQNPSHHGISGSRERGRDQCPAEIPPAARPARPGATLRFAAGEAVGEPGRRNQKAAEEETFPCLCTMSSSSAADAPA